MAVKESDPLAIVIWLIGSLIFIGGFLFGLAVGWGLL